jgi:hypothetical protein
VSAILDTNNRFAYLQNTNNNSYLSELLENVRFESDGDPSKKVAADTETEVMKKTLYPGIYIISVVTSFDDFSTNSFGERGVFVKANGYVIFEKRVPSWDMGPTGVSTIVDCVVLREVDETEEISVCAYHTSDNYSDVHCTLKYIKVK